jgi:rare lipoprotein A
MQGVRSVQLPRFNQLARRWCSVLALLLLAACSSVPTRPAATPPASAARTPAPATLGKHPSMPAANSGRGGYYQDDGPGENAPANLLAVPDAEPKIEPILPSTAKPYVVFGKTYTPIASNAPLKQRGLGSWYGKKFHGQKTSSGERYDMYKMTAAHPTMPLPSYARVTNVANGKQVIVRVNDRGPFHSSRIIDLSYTAAMKLGYLSKGSTELEVERLLPDEIARMEKSRLGDRAVPLAEVVVPTRPNLPIAPPVARLDTMLASESAPASEALPTPSQKVLVTASAEPVPVPDSGRSTIVLPTDTDSGSAYSANYYLQLGAFSQAANAQASRTRLQERGLADLPPLEIVPSGAAFKLFSGPFSSRAEAAIAAQKMQDSGELKPFIVQR